MVSLLTELDSGERFRSSANVIAVYNFHKGTLQSACEIAGILGKDTFADLSPSDIMRRVSTNEVRTLSELFPEVEPGCLLDGSGPQRLQTVWEHGSSKEVSSRSWIY